MTRRELFKAIGGGIAAHAGLVVGQKVAEPKPEPAVLRDPLLEEIRSGKGKRQRMTAVTGTKIEIPPYGACEKCGANRVCRTLTDIPQEGHALWPVNGMSLFCPNYCDIDPECFYELRNSKNLAEADDTWERIS